MNDLPVFHHVEHVLRHVVLNVDLAEILRHPPPSFHVDDDALNVALARRLARTVATACLQQRLPQILKLLVHWMQRLEIIVGRRRNGDLGEHDLRVAYGRIEVEDAAEVGGIDTAPAGEAGIFQNGKLKLDLSDSLLIRCLGQDSGRRKLEGRGRQAPIVGLADLVDGRLRSRRESHWGDPHGRSPALRIESIERGEIGGMYTFAQIGIGKLVANAGDDRIGNRGRRGYLGLRWDGCAWWHRIGRAWRWNGRRWRGRASWRSRLLCRADVLGD